MIHYAFIGVTLLVGSLGVVGTIAAVVACLYLGPAAVLAIVEPLFAKFIACTRCVVSVAFVLAAICAYWVGHHEAENQCRAKEQNSIEAAKREDRTITQKAAADENNLASPIEAQSTEQHQKDVAENETLKTQPGCAFDDTDAGAPGSTVGRMLPKFRALKARPPAVTK